MGQSRFLKPQWRLAGTPLWYNKNGLGHFQRFFDGNGLRLLTLPVALEAEVPIR